MTDGVMVAQRFLAPFVGVRVPIGQKDASKEAFFCIPIWDENAMGSTTKVAKQTFCGKLCEAKARRANRAPLCECPCFIFIVKPTFYKVELLLYNFKVRLYANIYIVLT